MKIQIRKEKDEYSIAELRVQMKALENALGAEIRRRIQLNREIEQRCESQGMLNNFDRFIFNFGHVL